MNNHLSLFIGEISSLIFRRKPRQLLGFGKPLIQRYHRQNPYSGFRKNCFRRMGRNKIIIIKFILDNHRISQYIPSLNVKISLFRYSTFETEEILTFLFCIFLNDFWCTNSENWFDFSLGGTQDAGLPGSSLCTRLKAVDICPCEAGLLPYIRGKRRLN